MNANELRYGNKLLFLGEVVTFEFITNIRDEKVFWVKSKENITEHKSFHFKPIPLTEEWLLRFGFYKYSGWDDQIYWRKKEMDLLATNQSFEMPSGKNCEFVHILQNAYFFTELEELTLKTEL